MRSEYFSEEDQARADRVEALGHVLLLDSTAEDEAFGEDVNGRSYHIADMGRGMIVLLTAPADEVDEWLTDRELLTLGDLESRVAALGHTLFRDYSADEFGPRWYVCDPKTRRIPHMGVRKDINEWCTKRESSGGAS